MLRGLFILWMITVGGILLVDCALTGNRPLQIAAALNDRQAARLEHALGEVYYACGRYQNAAFYFERIIKDHPNTADVEPAFFDWLESAQYGRLLRPSQITARCMDYLQRYPQSGDHAQKVRLMYYVYSTGLETDPEIQMMALRGWSRKTRFF